MRRGGGKSKGASFERDVCKALSLWISAGTAEDVFWRSAMSGGRSTVAAAKGKSLAQQAGDISAVSRIGAPFIETFYVECKFYRDLKFHGLMTGTGQLATFWGAAKTEAKRYEKLPILIAKQNQLPVIACLSHFGLETLKLAPQRCVLTAPKLGMSVLLFDDFLKHARFADKDKEWKKSAHTALGGTRTFK
jgi:hypothetical protein